MEETQMSVPTIRQQPEENVELLDKEKIKEYETDLQNAPNSEERKHFTSGKIYSKLLRANDSLEEFQSKRIDPNTAANFIRTLPTLTLKQKELRAINNHPELMKTEKEEINKYYNNLKNVIKIIKLQLNFKPFFNIASSDLITASAYIQEITDDKGKILEEPNLVLQDAYEEKLEEF